MLDTPNVKDLILLLRLLVREPSVTGVEESFFRVIRRELEEFPITITPYHGLLVAQGERPDSMYLSAHVDRNGLLCTGPNEFQYAAFIAGNRGELHGDSISEQLMDLIADRFQDQRVQAHSAHAGSYLGQGTITDATVCPRRRNLIFEVDGLEFIQPGTPVSFLDRLTVQDGRMSAQLDNVAMVAVLIYLYRLGFQGTVLLSAGEEAGRSWRYVVEWFQRQELTTDRLLVVDTSPFPEDGFTDQHVVLRNRDANARFNSVLNEQLLASCQRLGAKHCFKDEYVDRLNLGREKPMSLGRTEMGRIIKGTEGAITGSTLQLPTTSYHTANETATVESYEAILSILIDLINRG